MSVKKGKRGMNIVYVGYFKLPSGTAAAQLIRGMATIAKEAGHKVRIVDIDAGGPEAVQIEESMLDGIAVTSIRYAGNCLGKWRKRFSYKYLAAKILPSSIVICYNFSSALMYRLLKDKKHNFVIVPCITEWYSAGEVRSLLSLFKVIAKKIDIEMRMRFLTPRSAGVIVCSELLNSFYRGRCKTLVIPTVIDYRQEKWNQEPLKLNQNCINFVYAGTIGTNKDYIIEIMKMLAAASHGRAYVFRILGVTKEQLILKYTGEKNLIERKEHLFYGRIPHEECIKIILSSDFSVLYRKNTRVANAGFPTKFAESMACGTPQIATDTSDIRNYIQKGQNGYLIDFNIDVASRQFESIFTCTREEIDRCKKYTRELKLFDYQLYVEPFKEFIEEIEKGKR